VASIYLPIPTKTRNRVTRVRQHLESRIPWCPCTKFSVRDAASTG
jgi:hypothetical protein